MSIKHLAQGMKTFGRNGDSMLVHMTPKEVGGLQALAMAAGGSLTTNPDTGLPEANFLEALLPTVLGIGLSMIPGVGPLAAAGIVGGGTALATGDIEKGLMAGLGAYGGAGIGNTLSSMGAAAGAEGAALATAGSAADVSAATGANIAAPTMANSSTLIPPSGAIGPAQYAGSSGPLSNIGIGLGQAVQNPGQFGSQLMSNLGGSMGAAAASYPLLNSFADEQSGSAPEDDSMINPYTYSQEVNPNFGMPGQPYYSNQTFTPQTPVPAADFGSFKQGGIASLAEGGEPRYKTPVKTVDPSVTAYNQELMNRATQEYVNSPQLGAFQSALPNQGNYNPEMGAAYQELQQSRAADNANIEPNKFGYKYDPVTGGVIKDESNMPAPAVANNSFNGFQDMMLYGNFNGGNGGDGPGGGGNNDGGNSGGCVDPDVMVLMADRTEKRAGDVQVGDMVYAPHQDTLEYSEFKVLENEVLQQPKLLVKFEDASTIIISDTHKFLMDNSAWKQMLHIKLGDVVRGLTGHKRIIGMEYIGDGDVIRFNIENAHTYISDGLISHNSKKEGGLIKRRYAQGGIAHLGGYSDGGQLLKGPGDGVSDDIPATIAGKQPARLANNEFVVPARIVSELGNGSTDAGAQALYKMMDRVQNARRKTMGKDNVAVDTQSTRYLPA